MGHNKLTDKQDKYAQAIANKTYEHHWKAYESIYDTKKMSKNAMYVEACLLLQNPKVSQRIKDIEDKIKDKEKLTLDEIIVRLSKRNEVNIRGYVNDDGAFKKMSELTDDQAVFITGFKVSEIWGKGGDAGTQLGRIVDVKIESFKDVMDMLIRHWGGYAKDKESNLGSLDEIKALIEQHKSKSK